MNKIIFILSIIFVSINLSAQVDLVAGMGISFVASPSLNDYLNNDEELSTFNSTVEFYGEVDYSVSQKVQLGFEYVYSLWSYNGFTGIGSSYNLEYTHRKPSLLAYYVIVGEGYKFKFGVGAGLRIVDLTEKIYISEDFSTLGFGFLFRAQGHTKLGDSFYANVGGTMRFDFPGEPSNGERKIHNNITNENVNINSFSVSVDIGVSYFF